MTPATRSKQGGLNLNKLAALSNYSRLKLDRLFNKDPLKFDELLIKAMKQQCIDDIFALKLNLANNINNLTKEG